MRLASWLTVLLVAATPASAALIDFEDLPIGTILTDQYQSTGVVFSLIGSSQAGPLVQLVGTHAIAPSSDYLSGAFDYDIQIDFLGSALSASIRVLDAEEPFTIFAYNGSTQVGIATVQGDGRGPGGPAYIASYGATQFNRLVIDLTNDLGSGAGGPEAYDSLRFELAPQQAPEPATLALLGLGLVSIAASRRRTVAGCLA
jgi:hypothetical protein